MKEFIFFAVFVSVVTTMISSCASTASHKDADAAYDRLRAQGYTAQQIYEMGK